MRTIILSLFFFCLSFFSLAQNFFPIKTGDKLQFEIIQSHDEPGYSWNHTTFEKSLVSEINTLGHTYYSYKNGFFRYDSLNHKLYRLVSNIEKLAYDFNKQPNETDTLYILGVARLFTYQPDEYINILGSNRLLKKAHWTYSFGGTESGELQIVEGIGILKKYEYYILGQNYDVTKDILISALIDSSVYNPLNLSISAILPTSLSSTNNQFAIPCNINCQYLGLVNILKADVLIHSGNNIIYSDSFGGDIENQQINIGLPASLLVSPNFVNIRIICKDNSIFENEAFFPDTGYVNIPCLENSNSWSSLFVPGFAPNWYYLSAMKFFNNNVGKIFTQWGNHDNPIWETTNGGLNWTKFASVPKYYEDKNFQMIDSMYSFCLNQSHEIFRTTDGGNNLNVIYSRQGNRNYSISFINRNEGWVAVDFRESATNVYPAILKTTNSGNEWSVISVNLGASINEIDFISSSVGFLQTVDGNLYKSADGGNTWNQISSIPDYNILYIKDELNGWAIGNGVSKTVNGGTTWTKLISGNFWDAVFFNSNYGWILGTDSLGQNAIFYTVDGGIDWVRKSFGVQSKNLFIDFINEQKGWILFEDGTLMKTVNSGLTFVKEEELSFAENYLLNQNYPNPFNPSTKISWQSPVSGWQTLKVYDVLGNEVATLVNEYRNAGSYEVNFNASKLSSGVYFYQLKTGDFIQIKKMILLK